MAVEGTWSQRGAMHKRECKENRTMVRSQRASSNARAVGVICTLTTKHAVAKEQNGGQADCWEAKLGAEYGEWSA